MDDYMMAMGYGYYFDRCVDLEFYDGNGNKVYELKTPKNGIKPSVTIKGSLIEGAYGVDTSISIQNMSYSVDINSVELIRCKMYYSGMEDSLAKAVQLLTRASGTYIDFRVLYADQDKEPPNRAVRFQCVVASECQDMYDITVDVTQSGVKFDSGAVSVPPSGTGGKKDSMVSMTLLDFLKQMADARNLYVNAHYTGKKKPLRDALLINSIDCPKDKANMKIAISPGKYKFGTALRLLGSMKPPKESDTKFANVKATTFMNSIVVTVIAPKDWEKRAESAGKKTEEEKAKFYVENYSNERQTTVIGGSLPDLRSLGSKSNPIKLNFVKAAYRTETLITASTIFDSRLTPGKYCVIKSDAIMGKGRSGSKVFNRITDTGNEAVFRITGAIEYEFSTTEQSYMTFCGSLA